MAEKNSAEERVSSTAENHSCTHYSRACSLVAPCCSKPYPCRICHDEKESHQIDRFAVKEVKCRKCNQVQPVGDCCIHCSVRFARYFCSICNLYDDAEKGQYHCTKCGICRIGGRDNFIHCDTCGLCLQVSLMASHKCVQEASRSNCPVCMEDIHTSRNAAHVPDCGHLLHKKCFTDMLENGLYQCPQCQTSLIEMTSHWNSMDSERERWLLPNELRDFQVKIHCRDCRKDSETSFHFIGLKCINCGSYNTVRNGNETLPLEDVDPSAPFNINSLAHDTDDNEYLNNMISLGFQLHPTPSTDSEDDEYETPSLPDLTDEDDFMDEEFSDQLLGGIPLLPPWLPQHSNGEPEILHLANQLPLHLNLDDNHAEDISDDDDDEESQHHSWNNSVHLPPYVHLGNSFLPMSLMGIIDSLHAANEGSSPHVWEVDDNESEEENGYGGVGGAGLGRSDQWETDSEEEVVGGDEENLGKEDCQVTNTAVKKDGETNQIGDMAPAD